MIQLTHEHIDAIEDILWTTTDGGEIREDYSGRGMFGDQCFGITLDGGGDLFKFAMLVGKNELLSEVFEDAGPPNSDSMGLGVIYYWPRLAVETNDGEEY